MGILFSNNASGTLAGSHNSSATALTLTTGQGALFPAPSGGDYFYATIVDASNNIEIVKCTGRTTDTLTVVRGQEGTTAMALSATDKVDLRLTAAGLAVLRDSSIETARLADSAVTTAKIANSNVSTAKLADSAVSTAKLADGAVTAAKMATGASLANLGFTPVRQGGGTGQDTNTVYMGWAVASLKFKLQVDSTDKGFLLTETAEAEADSAGYRGAPQTIKNTNYSFVLADSARSYLHNDATGHAWTIQPDSSVDFQEGTAILLLSKLGTVTVTPGSGVTLVWVPTGATGARTMAANGMAIITKRASDEWVIAGVGLA